jgi:hypothetical protein
MSVCLYKPSRLNTDTGQPLIRIPFQIDRIVRVCICVRWRKVRTSRRTSCHRQNRHYRICRLCTFGIIGEHRWIVFVPMH